MKDKPTYQSEQKTITFRMNKKLRQMARDRQRQLKHKNFSEYVRNLIVADASR